MLHDWLFRPGGCGVVVRSEWLLGRVGWKGCAGGWALRWRWSVRLCTLAVCWIVARSWVAFTPPLAPTAPSCTSLSRNHAVKFELPHSSMTVPYLGQSATVNVKLRNYRIPGIFCAASSYKPSQVCLCCILCSSRLFLSLFPPLPASCSCQF